MQVIFVMKLGEDRVGSVHWQEGGLFVGRTLMDDGSIADDTHDRATHLSDVAREVAGGHGHTVGAEVDDIRSALKYLGKSSDLVEMLPQVDVWKDAPRREVENAEENWQKFLRATE